MALPYLERTSPKIEKPIKSNFEALKVALFEYNLSLFFDVISQELRAANLSYLFKLNEKCFPKNFSKNGSFRICFSNSGLRVSLTLFGNARLYEMRLTLAHFTRI